jgi:Cu/Ag efflux protein CusF
MMRPSKVLVGLGLFAFLAVVGYVSADETKGTVKSVDAGRNEVVLKGTIKDTIYELKRDANVFLDGVKANLTDLKEGDKAQITFEKRGEHNEAIYVRALRKCEETTAKIHEIANGKNEITLKGTVKNTTYELGSNASVWIGNKKMALTDLKVGDEVRVTYEKRGDRFFATEVYRKQ